MTTITLNSIIRRNDNIIAADVMDDEIVLMRSADWHYVGLNAVGSEIWRKLDTARSVASLCDELAADFADAPLPTIQQDVIALLTKLSDRNLVEVDN